MAVSARIRSLRSRKYRKAMPQIANTATGTIAPTAIATVRFELSWWLANVGFMVDRLVVAVLIVLVDDGRVLVDVRLENKVAELTRSLAVIVVVS